MILFHYALWYIWTLRIEKGKHTGQGERDRCMLVSWKQHELCCCKLSRWFGFLSTQSAASVAVTCSTWRQIRYFKILSAWWLQFASMPTLHFRVITERDLQTWWTRLCGTVSIFEWTLTKVKENNYNSIHNKVHVFHIARWNGKENLPHWSLGFICLVGASHFSKLFHYCPLPLWIYVLF